MTSVSFLLFCKKTQKSSHLTPALSGGVIQKEHQISPVTHLLVGWLSSNTINLGLRERCLVTYASIAPDIDGFGLAIDFAAKYVSINTNYWGQYHHELHTLLFSIIVSIVVYLFAKKRKLVTSVLAFTVFNIHLLCDLIGARGPDGYQWPIPYLKPFYQSVGLTWSGQWELNAWQNIIFTLFLVVLVYLAARVKQRTPFEVVSNKMNAFCLNLLRCK